MSDRHSRQVVAESAYSLFYLGGACNFYWSGAMGIFRRLFFSPYDIWQTSNRFVCLTSEAEYPLINAVSVTPLSIRYLSMPLGINSSVSPATPATPAML
jgi:hypothetical protein